MINIQVNKPLLGIDCEHSVLLKDDVCLTYTKKRKAKRRIKSIIRINENV